MGSPRGAGRGPRRGRLSRRTAQGRPDFRPWRGRGGMQGIPRRYRAGSRRGGHRGRPRALRHRAGRNGSSSAAHRLRGNRRHSLRRHAIPKGHRRARAGGAPRLESATGPFIMDIAGARDYFADLQTRIVTRLEAIDGGRFNRDAWTRDGGGGVSRIIEQGTLFERGGVNFSHVRGERLPPSASATRPQLAGRGFEVMGVSLVLHPRNPYVPTVHLNVRLFVAHEAGTGTQGEPVWWF